MNFLVPIKLKTLFLLGLLTALSCNNEQEAIFELNPVEVSQGGVDKPNVKSAKAYLSIAHQDLFDRNISKNLLNSLSNIYVSFGDVEVINELVIKNFLKKEGAKIPSNEEMRADVDAFVQNTFERFYNRAANEQELWFFKTKIEENEDLSPDVIYFAILTSKEYKNF